MDLRKYIVVQKKKAESLGLDFIKDIIVSPLKTKKYRVILNDGYYIDYGHKDYEDFLQHKDKKRRENFIKRWKNNPNANNIHSPVFYILRLTW